jgi:DNA polymerase-3 subunit delta'
MAIAPLLGHEALRKEFGRAIAADRLPQVLLLTGPHGVGKQRLGLWLAQRLLCTTPQGDEPCGTCPACLKVLNLTHPDLHWFVPIPRPKAAEPDKQADEAAELIEAALAERRNGGVWQAPDGMASHGIASARLLLRQASLTAVESGWRIFLIGRAERLVPQESSPDAANALLKILEEPPRHALFILTSAEPSQVLPTIRSRSVPVRLGPVSREQVSAFFRAVGQPEPSASVLTAARGAIGAALELATERASPAEAKAEEFVASLRGTGDAAERALRQGPWQARGEFTDLLDALAERFLSEARVAATDPRSIDPVRIAARLDAIDRVMTARERAQGNVNPQLLLAELGSELRQLGVA